MRVRGVYETFGLGLYTYAHQNPVKLIDPDGNFVLYVETEGSGHVGIQTNYNGNHVNYDFGRYNGKYSLSIYSGPGIYRRTGGKPGSSRYEGYTEFDFNVSQELDNAVALKFREAFDSGTKSFPEEVSQRMPKGKRSLNSTERYSGQD